MCLSHLCLSHLCLSHLRLSHLSRLLVCSLRYVLVDDGLMVFDLSRHLSLLFVNRLT